MNFQKHIKISVLKKLNGPYQSYYLRTCFPILSDKLACLQQIKKLNFLCNSPA